jgi:hypothetical protein
MIGPVSTSPKFPIKATSPVKRRSNSKEIEFDGTLESEGMGHAVHVRDFSSSGATVYGSKPKLSNDMFVELHIEGQESRKATVVSEVLGGYVIRFKDKE